MAVRCAPALSSVTAVISRPNDPSRKESGGIYSAALSLLIPLTLFPLSAPAPYEYSPRREKDDTDRAGRQQKVERTKGGCELKSEREREGACDSEYSEYSPRAKK